MLDLLSRDASVSETDILKHISFELRIEDEEILNNWFSLALKNIHHADLASVFSPQDYLKIYNECPIQYTHNNKQAVYGVIDRLLISEDKAIIIDYKTHHYAADDNIEELSQSYQKQMQLYADGVKKLWPDLEIQAYLLFTECNRLQPVNINH